MQVKDIYASGSGGSAKNPQLVAQSRQEKNAQMAARAGSPRSEAEPDASQGKKTGSMPLRTEQEEREALALGLDTGYNVTRSFYTLQDAQRDVQDTLNKLKELRRSAPQEPAESAATETDAEPPKAADSWKTLMKKLAQADDSPEIRETLGIGSPSGSPEEVAAEDRKGQKVMDVPRDSLRRLRPQEQYRINSDWDLSAVMDEKRRINGQGREEIKDMLYGASTVGEAGCESIAVYNLLRDLGISITLPEVIRTADEINSLFFGGKLGITPAGTKRLLREYGIQFEEVNKGLVQAWADHGHMFDRERYIAIIWNQKPENSKEGKTDLLQGIHTFLMVYDEKGEEIDNTGEIGNWIVYNRSDRDETERVYKDLTSVLREKGSYWKILRIKEDRERIEE